MKYLAINTAAAATEVLLCDGNNYHYWKDSDFKKASESLLPAINDLLNKANLVLQQMDFFSVVIGPGSFTGIRIGISTARAFCYALKKPCICVNNLELLAYNLSADTAETLIALADGSNGTIYVAAYDNAFNQLLPPCVMETEQVRQFVDSVDEPANIVADSYIGKIFSNAKVPSDNFEAFKHIINVKSENQQFVDFAEIEPLYIRVSQAEKDLL